MDEGRRRAFHAGQVDIARRLAAGASDLQPRKDVLGLGQYGRTLTVLTCDGLSAEKESEYDNEDDELIESWTPKFRR